MSAFMGITTVLMNVWVIFFLAPVYLILGRYVMTFLQVLSNYMQ